MKIYLNSKSGYFRGPLIPISRGFILLPVVMALTLISAIAFLMNREGAMQVHQLAGEIATSQAEFAAKAGLNHAIWQANNASCNGYSNFNSVNLGADSYSSTISPASSSPVKITSTGIDDRGARFTINRDRVKVYQPVTTMTLTLGTDPGMDSYLSSAFSTVNYGVGENSVLKTWIFGWFYRHQLIKFDLPTTLPATARIVSAQLQLYQKSGAGSGVITAYRLTRNWLEGTQNGTGTADGVTWKTYDGTNSWENNGGDYASIAIAKATVNSDNDVWRTWEIGHLVQDWVSGKYNNNGLLLKTDAAISQIFASKENTTASIRPRLVINYTCECGQSCNITPACDAEYATTIKTGEFSTLSSSASNIKGLTFYPAGSVFNGVIAPTGGAWVSVDSGTDQLIMTDMSGTFLTQVAAPDAASTGVAYVSGGIHAGQFAVTDYGFSGITWVNDSGTAVSKLTTTTTNPYGVTYLERTASGTYDGSLAIISANKAVSIYDQNGNRLRVIDVSALTVQPEDLVHIPKKDRFLIVDRGAQKVIMIDFNGTEMGSYSLSGYGLSNPYGIAINPLTCDHALGDLGKDVVTLLNKNLVNTSTLKVDALGDTNISEDSASSNYGSSSTIYVGRASGQGKLYKGLLKFDVSGLPSNATVTAATLRLNQTTSTGSGSFDIGVYKIIATWNESSVKWSNFNANSNYDTTQLAVTSVATGTTGFKEWSLPPALINEWIDGVPQPNYGLALVYESNSKGNVFQFASKENSTVGSRPQLVINYTTP
jgi:Disaggregatase related repeat